MILFMQITTMFYLSSNVDDPDLEGNSDQNVGLDGNGFDNSDIYEFDILSYDGSKLQVKWMISSQDLE